MPSTRRASEFAGAASGSPTRRSRGRCVPTPRRSSARGLGSPRPSPQYATIVVISTRLDTQRVSESWTPPGTSRPCRSSWPTARSRRRATSTPTGTSTPSRRPWLRCSKRTPSESFPLNPANRQCFRGLWRRWVRPVRTQDRVRLWNVGSTGQAEVNLRTLGVRAQPSEVPERRVDTLRQPSLRCLGLKPRAARRAHESNRVRLLGAEAGSTLT
jgi:hypothetical protein